MPRVLSVMNRLVIGGPAVVTTYLAKYLHPDFETLMVVGGQDDHEQDATYLADQLGIKPYVIPDMKRAINWKDDRVAYKKMKSIIQKFKPDIVHTHAAKSGAIGRLAATSLGVPVVIHTFHGHVFHSYFSPLKTKAFIWAERYLAKRSSGIIAISKQQKEELADTYKICAKDKIKVVSLGLDLDKFRVDQENKRSRFRNLYQIEPDEIVVGIVGRVVPIKNHNLFVAAAKRVLESTNKRVRFFIIGDGDMRKEMELDFTNHGIDYTYYPDNARKATAVCTSWQTTMDVVYAGIDIVALTSNNEGTPMSLIEGQAAGKPVVSTNVGGVLDVILEKESGFACPSGDAAAFARALLQLIESPELRYKFGLSGQNFVHQNFSYQRMVKETADYYYELLRNKQSFSV